MALLSTVGGRHLQFRYHSGRGWAKQQVNMNVSNEAFLLNPASAVRKILDEIDSHMHRGGMALGTQSG